MLYALIATPFVVPVATAAPSSTPFSIEPGSFQIGLTTPRAGAHPDLTIGFGIGHGEDGRPFNDLKDTIADLPPGFAGAMVGIPTCSIAQLLNEGGKQSCPLDAQVGTVSLDFTVASASSQFHWTIPVFNMEPPGGGSSAQLGFRQLVFSQLVPLSVRADDGGLRVDVSNTPLLAEVTHVSMTLWGIPASPAHDAQRGQECTAEEQCEGGGNPTTVTPAAFIVNPTHCGPAVARIEADSWEEQGVWSQASTAAGPILECESVPFDPSVELDGVSPTAESPTGLDLELRLPQDVSSPDGSASSAFAGMAIDLPTGMSINPAAVRGACTRAELERETLSPSPGRGCPSDAALGTVEISSPLIAGTATGSVFLAGPHEGPDGALVGLFIVARAPASGVVLRLEGKVLAGDPGDRLRIVFDTLAQLPLSRIALHFAAGSDSLLVTPPTCGDFDLQALLIPASAPESPRTESRRIEIGSAPGGLPCSPGGSLPFRPGMALKLQNPDAGEFSPASVNLVRRDGEAPIVGASLQLPPGLLANLTGVSICSDAALARAVGKSGEAERADPSCPAGSTLGRVAVGVGVGDTLASVRGSLYLAGEHDGAPLSLAAVVPALRGPFDLGTQVFRSPLRLDSATGAVQVGSLRRPDPIPRSLEGISLHIRSVDVFLNRPRLLRSPTGCTSRRARAALLPGDGGGDPIAASAALTVRGCDRLPFAPGLDVRLLGGVRRNGHPRLRIAFSARPREASLARGWIDLPRALLLDPAGVRDVCSRRRLREGRCPDASAYGTARAFSPLMPEPLVGPVYLAESDRGLPRLVAALSSAKFNFHLTARLVPRDGRLRLVLVDVPDLPISNLSLSADGGSGGLFVDSANLCAVSRRAPVRMIGHNGRALDETIDLGIGCPNPRIRPRAGGQRTR